MTDHTRIIMDRTLSTSLERKRVMSRFLTWAKEKGYDQLPAPSVLELRWSDDFTRLWVSKTSGLIEHGFGSLFPEHEALADNEHFAIYTDSNPAARVLLAAIKDATAHKLEQSNG